MKTVVVDYKKGNIRSVERALASCGADVLVSSDPRIVRESDAIVLPGVGAFTDAMSTISELGLDSAIKDAVSNGKPFLGICLGLHLMFEGGEEHAQNGNPTPGLGFIPGIVSAMPSERDGVKYKIPHVGWNSVSYKEDEPLFAGIPQGEHFYFTHSFIAPESNFTIAETTHSVTFPCAVRKGNVMGVQFHPEKSSNAGARLLENFIEFAKQA